LIFAQNEADTFCEKIENIQNTESEEYSNPASELCSKLPECVDVLTPQNLNVPWLPDYQILQ